MARPDVSSPSDPTERLVGRSPSILALRRQIHYLAAFDTVGNPDVPTLLLQGETGTGKGLVARIIHESGPRAGGPCIEVNCAAIPDTLLEAELFGFEAGAFSEAKRAKPGLFEAASGGVLFLDEIDSLPLALQGKLLTALEGKQVRRLGAVRERAVDVKLIAASQMPLCKAAQGGRFRADLYHRLAVILLDLPPLRARGEDIRGLAVHYLHRCAAAHGLRPKQLSPEAEAWLVGYRWPGNVRELSHLMERVTLLSDETVLAPATLERLCLGQIDESPSPLTPTSSRQDITSTDEVARIRQALAQTGGKVVQAARLLGLSRGRLRYRMQRYGLERSMRGEAPALPTIHQAKPTPLRAEGRGVASREKPAAVSSWEQKLVAVLAIDLTFPHSPDFDAVGYEPWTVARRWEQAVGEKVQGFGGSLMLRHTSLLMAAFGLPHTLEQLPQRAVQAALAIRQLVTEARSAPGWEPIPEIRQGLHLGPMLVEGQAREAAVPLLAVGETLSIATRLLGRAAAGEVLVSPQLGRLIEGWCELRALDVSLGAEPPSKLEASRVEGLVPRRSPLAELRMQARSPFVGREQELATLHELLAHVEGGRGRVAGIAGEPGMGKSRLLYEFRQSLTGHSVTYLEGRCLAYGSAMPSLPILDLLRDRCGITATDGPEAIAEKVHLALQEVGMDPDEGAPYLLYFLGVPAGIEQLTGFGPEAIKTRTFEILRQLSLHDSEQRPLIIAIEDIHWIDPTSEAFLAWLVDSLIGVRILLLTTYRPGYHPAWLGKSYATQIVLHSLGSQDSLCVVQAALQMEHLPEPLARLILAKAQGNPFFLEELVQALVEQGVFVRQPGGGARPADLLLTHPLTVIQLPPTVQGVLAARIDRLPTEAKGLLHTVAVIGKEFSLNLVKQVVRQTEEELQELLADLQAAELLYEQPAFSEPAYAFKHVLTQEVAYTSLPRAQRRELHERIAQALEALFPERQEDHYSELAHHYSCSGNVAKAVEYLQRVGHQAAQRSAHVEAINHLTTALKLLMTLPDTPERTQQELTLRIALGVPLMATKGFAAPEVESAYARARDLSRQMGDSPQLFTALRGLWRFYSVRAEFQTAQEIGEQLLRLAERAKDPPLILEAHLALGNVLFWRGKFGAARVHLERVISLYHPQQYRAHAFLYGLDPGVIGLSYAAHVLWLLGYPDQALQRNNEALTLAQELSHPHTLAHALGFAASLHQLRREGQSAQVRAEAVMALSKEQEFPQWLAWGTILRGWSLVEQGQEAEGMAQIRQGLAGFRAMGAALGEPYWFALLAEACGKVGQAEDGLRLLAEALLVVDNDGERRWEAELYRLKGDLTLRQAEGRSDSQAIASEGDLKNEIKALLTTPVLRGGRSGLTEGVEASLHQALDIARRQHAKSLELRAAMCLGRLWRQQGKCEDARRLLADIYTWFTEGFDTADLEDAKALLDELS